MQSKKLRALAVILPQFHPIPENDNWWGKGFTEWTNVVKARPRFNNHYQPQLPSETSYYDLRLAETRQQQADLAKEHDIAGFCIYHYWFNGHRLLESPVDRMLALGKPEFPFMLCWANENWSRRWDGLDKEVLIEQKYSADDHKNHAKWMCENAFKSEHYIKIDGKPFFLFYKPEIIPNLKETIEIWRNEVKKHGFEDIYLGAIRTSESKVPDAIELGFDITVEWQPDWENLPAVTSFWHRIKNKLKFGSTYKKIEYSDVVSIMKRRKQPYHKHFLGITPGWDNSARRKENAFVMHDSTPELYADWLADVCKNAKTYSDDENFIFINAWNEWAEGNHLEPCQKWGRKYLQKTKEILNNYK